MVTKVNTRMETHMEAMEKAIEENREEMEARLSLIEGIMPRLATPWERKPPELNAHVDNLIRGNKGNTV